MSNAPGEELYGGPLIAMLEQVWGEGWLSPGGPEEVARLLDGIGLADKHILDIGCGAGGVDVLLAGTHNAARVTGIDVEETVLSRAKALVAKAGLGSRIDLVKVAPGPLPFEDSSFDIVFSKDSIVHIPDKHALMAEVFRVLKPGGWFVASDWLIGHDGEPSAQMQAYIASEGLNFGMASPSRYRDAMERVGFENVEIRSRNPWYRERARAELALMRGPLYVEASARLGREFVDHNIEIWTNMLPVLDSGEHCPSHLLARKPSVFSRAAGEEGDPSCAA